MPTTAAMKPSTGASTLCLARIAMIPMGIWSIEPGPSSIYEAELEKLENDENDGGPGTEEGWDELLSDDEEEDNLDMSIDLDSD
ncbi:hypothetical protein C0995_012330 [Termitomyces sp. Mi166|nr:hypothetical protein C0995_012330 [Termitomyces sp. Mi166\